MQYLNFQKANSYLVSALPKSPTTSTAPWTTCSAEPTTLIRINNNINHFTYLYQLLFSNLSIDKQALEDLLFIWGEFVPPLSTYQLIKSYMALINFKITVTKMIVLTIWSLLPFFFCLFFFLDNLLIGLFLLVLFRNLW